MANMSNVDLKVVFLGQSNVGKTCLVDRYLNGKFRDDMSSPTVGAAFGAKKVDVGGNRPLTVGVWDTAGAERFEAMSRLYYRGARAACVCFDLTQPETWTKVKFWVNELLSNEQDCSVYIVGTKADLVASGSFSRGIDVSVVEEYARQVQARIFETSAKTGAGVDQLFDDIVSGWVETGEGDDGGGARGAGGSHHLGSAPGSSCTC